MRKEILIAIVAGIMVGLAIAFGAWRANSAIKTKQQQNNNNHTTTSAQNKNTKTPQENLSLSLVHIENFDVFTETPIKITGITKSGSVVVISGEDEDYTLQAGGDGTFEQEISLVGGVNQILFSVYDNNGERVNKKIMVVYSSEFGKSINQ